MKLRTQITVLTLAAVLLFMTPRSAHATWSADLNVHNETGHTVIAFLFQDGHAHSTEDGGVQFAVLKNHQSAVAHVPNCTFSVLLVDHEDIWHAEFHDCHSTDMTFTSTTGHGHHGDHED
ncbi:MAG TPA: hypothetical protein VJ723_01275 [Candidatus Angelobacter sp.]|nr:hypothetical protein [Candidatus Angelobacter sp.]